MNHASGVQSGYAGHQLFTDVRCLAGFQLFGLLEAGIESFSLQQPHGEKQKRRRGLVAAKNLIDGAEIAVNHLTRKKHLLLEAGRGGCIGGDLGPDYFQSDSGVLKKLILRLVDLAHPTTSNETNNRKAAGDELPASEAARSGGRAHRRQCSRAIGGKGGMRKKATGARIHEEKLFDQAAKFRIMAARLVEESRPALRGQFQRFPKQFLGRLPWVGHNLDPIGY